MAYDILDELTDIERDKILAFNQDETLVEAVRKVLLATLYQNGTLRKGKKSNPTLNGAMALVSLASSGKGVVTNQDLGEDLRGLWMGIQLLEQGLKKLATIKKIDGKGEEPSNPAI